MGYRSIALCALALISSGCNSQDFPSGHYEGSLFQRNADGVSERTVSIDVTMTAQDRAEIVVTSAGAAELLRMAVDHLRSGSPELRLPAPWSQSVRLGHDSACYAREGQLQIQLCTTDSKLFLELADETSRPVLTLTGDKFRREKPFTMEVPRALTLNDAIDIALRKNFDSRIEYERLIQARQSARASYLNLLPHLSLSTVLNNVSPSLVSLLGSIGDLAPFLLPNRWLQANAVGHQARAEADALAMMRADLATTVEGLTYALIRDETALSLYAPLLERLSTTLPEVEKLEAGGQMLKGSALHVRAIIDWMKLDEISLDQLIDNDRQAIAGTLGFHNPDAISKVMLGDEVAPFADAKPLELDDLLTAALGRSFELRQLDELIGAARDSRTELFFSWLDPQGNPATELGPSLGPNVAVAKSKINELFVVRERSQANLANRLKEYVDDWNTTVRSRALMVETASLQAQRLEFVMSEIGSQQLNTLDIEAVVQDCLATGIRQAGLVAEYRVARAKIDRYLLQGHYSQVQAQTWQRP